MSDSRHPEYPIDAAFTDRWSPRAFTGEAIEEATLLGFLEAARWAPSAYNAQPWRFVYARRDTPAWVPIFESLVPFNQSWAQRASALVVVISARQWVPPGKSAPEPIATHAFDTGAAWGSLALQATLAGWYSHGMAGYDRAALAERLQVPESFHIEAVIAIGRRGDAAVLPEALQAREIPSQRRPLAEVAAEGQFSFKS